MATKKNIDVNGELTPVWETSASAQQIDDVVTGAVRFNAAQTLTAAQQTQARGNIGAAPGGGGLLQTATSIESTADMTYEAFCEKVDAVLAKMPDLSAMFVSAYPPQYYGMGRNMCVLYRTSYDYASLYTVGSYNYPDYGFRMIKRKSNSADPSGLWDPLEYVNPPMNLGVEYRTTERYQGKPVYTKLVKYTFGAAFGTRNEVSSLTIEIAIPFKDLVRLGIVLHEYGDPSASGRPLPASGSTGGLLCNGLVTNGVVTLISNDYLVQTGSTMLLTYHYTKE